jgi:hypothetical protein
MERREGGEKERKEEIKIKNGKEGEGRKEKREKENGREGKGRETKGRAGQVSAFKRDFPTSPFAKFSLLTLIFP